MKMVLKGIIKIKNKSCFISQVTHHCERLYYYDVKNIAGYELNNFAILDASHFETTVSCLWI